MPAPPVPAVPVGEATLTVPEKVAEATGFNEILPPPPAGASA